MLGHQKKRFVKCASRQGPIVSGANAGKQPTLTGGLGPAGSLKGRCVNGFVSLQEPVVSDANAGKRPTSDRSGRACSVSLQEPVVSDANAGKQPLRLERAGLLRF